MSAAAPLAALSDDRIRVVMANGTWRGDFPVADLQKWLAFYRGLRDRKGGRYARFYVETVGALERIEKELQQPEHTQGPLP